jgi:hypothetical protein
VIDPGELIDNLVALLREIPELVVEMEGDPQRIFAYHDNYPKRASLKAAVRDMPVPGIMAAWQGTSPGSFGGVGVWNHHVALYLRARQTEEARPTAYYRLFRLITKGVPTSVGVPMLNATVHPSCQPMELPLIERQADAELLDYFEVPLSFVEMGDD